MVHDLSPFILKFPETAFWGDQFGFRWYGFAYMLGFICAYKVISWLAERQRAGMTTVMVGDFITYAAIGTLVGGRLGYCLFYDSSLFLSFRPSFPFWGVLAVNEGGMASHGGIIGIIIACVLYARKAGLSYTYLLDLAAVTGPIGVFFGRIANFINGELVGRPSDPSFPLAVKFPSDILNWPTQEFDRLSTLTPVVEKVGVTAAKWSDLLGQFKTNLQARDQVYATLYNVIHDIQGGDAAAKDLIAPVLDPRHPSQLYAALGEGLFTFLILFFLMRKSHKPGFIAGSFVIIYAVVRIADEQFRMPDAHIGYQLFGLTRGQWLSIVMFVFGVVALVYWSRSQLQTVFGWSRGESVKVGRR
ncbi:MAG: prolipoprotein diacylglyceryl transferase [Bdellovibrio sp.]|nr:prolipoprotein diacylglyceryl transferase [Bdellovibrio sp.]